VVAAVVLIHLPRQQEELVELAVVAMVEQHRLFQRDLMERQIPAVEVEAVLLTLVKAAVQAALALSS
jgi:hypothetical protein